MFAAEFDRGSDRLRELFSECLCDLGGGHEFRLFVFRFPCPAQAAQEQTFYAICSTNSRFCSSSECSPSILRCRRINPSSNASGRGGHPEMYTSTGINRSIP